MRYFSHVLYHPLAKPFDQEPLLWPSFIGEFVAPLVTNRPDVLFWFTHYGDHSKLRLYTDRYEEIRPELEATRDKLGLVDRGQEKDLSLVSDLGHGRFISPNSTSTPEKRAEAILRALSANARLVVDSVVKRPDGYWQFEETADRDQNPDGSHMFSVMHLMHNMSASDAFVWHFQHGGREYVWSNYSFRNAVESGQLTEQGSKHYRVRM